MSALKKVIQKGKAKRKFLLRKQNSCPSDHMILISRQHWNGSRRKKRSQSYDFNFLNNCIISIIKNIKMKICFVREMENESSFNSAIASEPSLQKNK